jgi:hypothetical protein
MLLPLLMNQMKKLAVLIFINLFCSFCFSQKENYQWAVGYNGLMDFNSGTLSLGNTNDSLFFDLCNASICDTSGHLIIITNDNKVYNALHDTMLNSYDFNDSWFKNAYGYPYNGYFGLPDPQGAIIIPFPGNDSLYYIFHETNTDTFVSLPFYNFRLYYSIVNIKLDNGLGALTTKNIFMEDSLIAGQLTATKHGNGRDWWLMAKHDLTNIYYRWLITPSGILGPYSQAIGPVWNVGAFQAAFNNQGTRYATVRPPGKHVDLFNFDRCSGLLSNRIALTVQTSDSGIVTQGIAFSPDDRFLYVTIGGALVQYDTQAANIPASELLIAEMDSDIIIYLMQLAPDGKIYIGTGGSVSNVMYEIDNPDGLGTACNFIRHFPVFPTTLINVPPNLPNYSLGPETGSPCDTLTSIKNNTVSLKDLKIVPNPNNGNFSINYTLPQSTSGTLDIFNTLGEKVFEHELLSNKTSAEFNLSFLQQGVYFLNVKANGEGWTRKIVKM